MPSQKKKKKKTNYAKLLYCSVVFDDVAQLP